MTFTWDAPLPGGWARNFRLGEWLGDPVTPLFESWLLTRMEDVMHDEYERYVGQRASRPLHVIVNGWYFYSLNFLPGSPGAIVRWLPGLVPRVIRDPRRVAAMFPPLARYGVPLFVREWREQLLPEYLAACDRAAAEVEALPARDLPALVDGLATLAGRYFTSITFVAGAGWKAEAPLGAFYRDRLFPALGGSHLTLLQGLREPSIEPWAIRSLDWAHPTLVESGAVSSDPDAVPRHLRLVAEREAHEARCRAALASAPAALRRFDVLLRDAQAAVPLREEQLASFTRPWPVFRRALARSGDELVGRGVIASADDVHFLREGELRASLEGASASLVDVAAARRATWEAQRHLAPPLVLGTLPRMLETILRRVDESLRTPTTDESDVLVRGTAASAGHARGTVRVLRSLDDADRLRAGDILVCPATTPSWTTLFARAGGIVTDTGSQTSHASIVAREYGIPAVVGTGNATATLVDGDTVVVDGAAGLVRRAS